MIRSLSVLENGDDVVILMTLNVRLKATGEEMSDPAVQHVKIDREKGLIIEFRIYPWDVVRIKVALEKAEI